MGHKLTYQLTLANPNASVAATGLFDLRTIAAASFTSGGSDRGQIGQGRAMDIAITTDAVSGTTPTSDVTMDTSFDSGVVWTEIAAGTQVTTTDGVELETVTTRYAPLLRFKIVTGGTAPVYNYVLDVTEHFD